MVDPGWKWMIAGPYNLVFTGKLHHGNPRVGSVRSDHGIAIGQPLRTTRIFEQATDILVGHLPNHLPLGVHFDDLVAMGQRHDGMSIVESNGRKWPILSRPPTQRFQVGS